MRKRYAIAGAFLVAAVFAVCIGGCAAAAGWQALTAREFCAVMEEQGYQVSDQTEAADSADCVKLYRASDSQSSAFEYYRMKSSSAARSFYQEAVLSLEKLYGNDRRATIWEKISPTISDFQVSTSDYCCKVIRKDHMVIKMTAGNRDKQAILTLLQELGY